MANVLIGSLLRLVLKPPKKKTNTHNMSTMSHATPGQVEAGAADPNGTVATTNPSGLTPEEEAYAAKRKKIMRIVWIVGGLLTVCWLLDVPLLPFLKNIAKWASKSLKTGQKDGAANNGTETDIEGIDVGSM